MSTPTDVMRNFLAGTAFTKQAEVAQVTPQKKAEILGPTLTIDGYLTAAGQYSGKGADTMSGTELDARTLTPTQMVEKYGAAGAADLNMQAALGRASYQADSQADGDPAYGLGMAQNAGVNIVNGLVQGVGSLGAMGAGLVSDKAGAWASDKLNDVNEYAQSLETDTLQRRRAAAEARSTLRQRDDDSLYEKDKATDGSFVAGLSRIGREAIHGISDSFDDGKILQADTANAIGSLLAAGPVSKTLRGGAVVAQDLAKLAAPDLAQAATRAMAAKLRGEVAEEVAQGASAAAARRTVFDGAREAAAERTSAIATTASIAGMEGSGAYQQTMQQVMGMNHDDLMRNSPDYVNYINQGMTPEEAKLKIAGAAATQAGLVQGAISVPTAALVSKFEGNPLKGLGSTVNTLGTMGKEAVEEGIQSGTAQLAQNQAIQNTADKTQDITEGVGQQVGQGALLGSLSAGAVQAPHLAVTVPVEATKLAAKTAWNAVNKRGAEIQRRIDEGSVVNDKAMDTQANDITQAIVESANEPAVLKTEEEQQAVASDSEDLDTPIEQATPVQETADAVKAQVKDELSGFMRESFNPVTTPTGNEQMDALMAGSEGFPSAVNRVVKWIQENKAAKPDEARSMYENLSNIMDSRRDFLDGLENRLEEAGLSENDGLRIALSKVHTLMDQVQEGKHYNSMEESSAAMYKNMVKDLTPEQLAVPENAAAVARVASENVEDVTLDQVKTTLQHAASKRVDLSPEQVASLQVAQGVLEEAQAQKEKLLAQGVSMSNTDSVTNHVLTAEDFNGGKTKANSLNGHIKIITQAMSKGKVKVAKEQVAHLAKFIRTRNNKLAAINKALKEGKIDSSDTVPYQTIGWDGKPKEFFGQQGMFFNPAKRNSVELAKRIESEAATLVAAYNAIVSAYPNLRRAQLKNGSLDPALSGTVDSIVEAATAKNTITQMIRRGQRDAAPRSEPRDENRADRPSGSTVATTATETTGSNDGRGADEVLRGTDGRRSDDSSASETRSTDDRSRVSDGRISQQTEALNDPSAEEQTQEKTEQPATEEWVDDGIPPWKTDEQIAQEKAKEAAPKEATPSTQETEWVDDGIPPFETTEQAAEREAKEKEAREAEKTPATQELERKYPGNTFARMKGKRAASVIEIGKAFTNKLGIKFGDLIGGILQVNGPLKVAATYHGLLNTISVNSRTFESFVKEAGDTSIRDRATRVMAHELSHALDAKLEQLGGRPSSAPDFQKGGAVYAEYIAALKSKDPVIRTWFNYIQDVKHQGREIFAQIGALKERFPEKANAYFPIGSKQFDFAASRFADRTGQVQGVVEQKTGTGAEQAATGTDGRRTTPAVEDQPSTAPMSMDSETAIPASIQNIGRADTVLGKVYSTLRKASAFIRTFTAPRKAISKVAGDANAIQTVEDSMYSLDPEKLHQDTYESYKEFLSDLRQISDQVVSNVAAALKVTENRKGLGKVTKEQLLTDHWGQVGLSASYRLGHLMDQTENGLTLNRALLESAVLAAGNWFLNTPRSIPYRNSSELITDLGLTQKLLENTPLSGNVVNLLNQGGSYAAAVDALSNQIIRYWGVTANPNAPQGMVMGMAQAMAVEVLNAMKQGGMIEVDSVQIRADGSNNPDGGKIVSEYKQIKFPKDEPTDEKDLVKDPIFRNPSLIEELVMVEPETKYNFGNTAKVAPARHNQAGIANTAEQMEVIDRAQKIPFKPNLEMFSFISGLGLSNVLSTFVNGNLEDQVLNEQDRKSKEGQNLGIQKAFEEIQKIRMAIAAEAAKTGKPEAEIAAHYRFNMTSMGRLQMFGDSNPQANKLMRALMLSTWSNVDMTIPQNKDLWSLGMGQALDIKVHKQSLEQTRQAVQSKLDGVFAPAMSALTSWLKTANLSMSAPIRDVPQPVAKAVMDALNKSGVGDPAWAMFALMEHARLINATDEELKDFRTSMHMEADGVTNGPVNALMMMRGTARVTPQWVENARKGGWVTGNPMSMQDIRALDNVDLYEDSANRLRDILAPVTGEGGRIDDLLSLMDQLFGKDLTFDGDTLSISRGLTKNPLTITLYGSSAGGIAGNLADAMLETIYQRFSEAAKYQAENPEAEPLEAASHAFSSQDQAEYFLYLWEELTHKDADGVSNFTPKTTKLDFVKFQPHPVQYKNLSDNLKVMFVEPMQEAIEQTVGDTVTNSMTTLRVLTNTQSILAQAYYKKLEAEALATKPEGTKSLYLSQAEQDEIMQKVLKLVPPLEVGGQTFSFLSRNTSPEDVTSFGTGFTTNEKIEGRTLSIERSGVAGIPGSIIGSGDAHMINTAFLNGKGLENSLPVFDGVLLPMDRIQKDSEKLNAAAESAWMNNPIKAALKSFNTTFGNTALLSKLLDGNPQLVAELHRSMNTLGKEGKNIKVEQFIERWSNYAQTLSDLADINHEVMASVNGSTDQMAGAFSPHIRQGDDLSALGTDSAAIAAELQGRALSLMLKSENPFVRNEAAKQSSKPIEFKGKMPEEVGTKLDSGATRLEFTDLLKLARSMEMNQIQAGILREILRTRVLEGWTVLTGSPEQLAKESANAGNAFTAESQQAVHGAIVISDGSKKIYLSNLNPETMVHELIHAATIQIIQAVFDGQIRDKTVVEAVENLLQLTREFRKIKYDGTNPNVLNALNDAKAAIDAHLQNGDMPAAINEYMAWSLANQDLNKLLAKEKSPLVQLMADVINLIKKMIWGRTPAPKYADDFLSQTKFWTAVVINSQDAIKKDGSPNTSVRLNHATSPNSRITKVRDTFEKAMKAYYEAGLRTPTSLDPMTDLNDGGVLAQNMLTRANAAGFSMSPDESDTAFAAFKLFQSAALLDNEIRTGFSKLMDHALKYMKPEFFKDDPDSQDLQDIQEGLDRYDFFTNKGYTNKTIHNESVNLPQFIAMAMSSETFRMALSRLPDLPKVEKGAKTLDGKLEELANRSFELLDSKLEGSKNSKQILAALDNIAGSLSTRLERDEGYFLSAYLGVQGALDWANNQVTGMFQQVGDRAVSYYDRIKNDPTSSKVEKVAATAAQIGASLVHEGAAEGVQEVVVSVASRERMLQPIRRLLADLSGRDLKNAKVYDMIKKVRTEIQKVRNTYRNDLPEIFASKFKTRPTEDQWHSLLQAYGKTDLPALRTKMTRNAIVDMLGSPVKLKAKIDDLRNQIRSMEPDTKRADAILTKSQQLGKFMATGEVSINLLRNATAIAKMLNTSMKQDRVAPELIEMIDHLTSLEALNATDQKHLHVMNDMLKNESNGMKYLLDYMTHQREDEQKKIAASDLATLNHYKGYMFNAPKQGASLIVAEDVDEADLKKRGYVRVGTYQRSSLDPETTPMGYYYSDVSGKAPFHQGILQNIQHTGNGVSLVTGRSLSHLTPGSITSIKEVNRIKATAGNEKGSQKLIPVFDEKGNLTAYERSHDQTMLAKLQRENNLANSLANWEGRLTEEELAQSMNKNLIDNLWEMWSEAKNNKQEDQFIDLNSAEAQRSPVVRDALRLMTQETRKGFDEVFGEKAPIMVRRDMLEDVIGYRAASVTDVWSGVSNWSQGTRESAKNVLYTVFGEKAFNIVVKGERLLQSAVSDAKHTIAVKSLIVPLSNMTSNVVHLIGRGIPAPQIVKYMVKGLAEVRIYDKINHELVQIEADLRAARQPNTIRALENRRTNLQERAKRMAIWPLIEANEYTSMIDLSQTDAEREYLLNGRLSDYIEAKIDKLPSGVKGLAKNLFISRDTALYKGLEKSVHYGDFLAKFALYEHETKVRKVAPEKSLARITEEFVNYDRLPGRFRGALESNGLLWFYNFKLRSVKVAASTIRYNPLHTLLASIIPVPDVFGTVGLPIQDNFFSKLFFGNLSNSIGPGQLFRAPGLNPWMNLVN